MITSPGSYSPFKMEGKNNTAMDNDTLLVRLLEKSDITPNDGFIPTCLKETCLTEQTAGVAGCSSAAILALLSLMTIEGFSHAEM